MKINTNNTKRKVYFIGIGGISMSALAQLVASDNLEIGGSDISKSNITERMEKCFTIYYGHNVSNIIHFNPDLVVYTGAINANNAELKYALDNNIECIERSAYLGKICNNYQHVIAISGTHGKTTTTAMIGEIFILAGLNPTIHVGGEVINLNGNLVIGDKKYFITEACEYRKSFEHIKSDCAVITNIESNHMDCYKDYDDLLVSFNTFASNSNQCVIGYNNPLYARLNNKIVYTFSNDRANYYATNIIPKGIGYDFDVYEDNRLLSTFHISIMGKYNIENALIAIAVSRIYGINIPTIYSAIDKFKGVLRRNELIGQIGSTPVYADYCHHPTEIYNSINNFCQHFKKVLCIFQPHTYSRTKTLIKDFCKCFVKIDKLIIYKTYPAREDYIYDGSETYLYKKLKFRKKQLIMDSSELKKVFSKDTDYDCIIVLGAGDIYNIVKNILKETKQ